MPGARHAGACVALLALLGCQASTSAASHVAVVESHAEAFVVWSERGVRDRVLVHVDAHDDMLRTVPEPQLARLRELVRARRLDAVSRRLATGESELLDEGNFINAARHLGQVREIYWVIAFGSRDVPSLEAADRRALREMGFSAEQVRHFRWERGRLIGELHGVPFTVCALADLPRIEEPVLLDVDIDLFSVLASQNGIPLAESVRDFAEGLRRSRLRFDVVTIARSVGDGYTLLQHAWVARTLRELLSSRTLDLRQDEWWVLDHRSRAEAFHDRAQYEAAAALQASVLRRRPHDPSAHYALARSHLGGGQAAPAFDHATLAARLDPTYELGLVLLGQELAAKGSEEALRFFDGAEALAPASPAVTRARGDYYFDRAAFRDALGQYSRLDLDGDLALALRMGDAYRALGDEEDARMFYDLAEGIRARDTIENRQAPALRPRRP